MLGYLPALGELYRPVLIPNAVAEELRRLPGAPGSGAPTLDFVERRAPAASDVRRVEEGPPALDPGEWEAVALALGTDATAAVDDRRGVRRAGRLGVPTVGTLALLVELYRLGYASRSIEEDLARLREAGMYLTEDLRRHVLEALGG